MQEAFNLFEEAMNRSRGEKIFMGQFILLSAYPPARPEIMALNVIKTLDDCKIISKGAFYHMVTTRPFSTAGIKMEYAEFKAFFEGQWLKKWKLRLAELFHQDKDASDLMLATLGPLAWAPAFGERIVRGIKRDLLETLKDQAADHPHLASLAQQLQSYIK